MNPMLVDCPTDAATPTAAPLFPAVPERGTADDLTGDRANTESGGDCLQHIVLQNARSRFFPLHKSSRILAMFWPMPTTEFHDACVAADRRQHAHEWRRRAALPRRLLCTLFVSNRSSGLHVFVVETLSEV